MLRARIIPVLLVHKGGLVKTVRFEQPKYVGDPINAVRIFNEKEVDELMVADIDATSFGREPDYTLIARLAAECRMPLCYSGGVRTIEQFERIVTLGVEKVAVGSAAVSSPEFISQAASRVGRQSVVVVMDCRRVPGSSRYELLTHNAKRSTGRCPFQFARDMQSLGCGEIIVNSVDQDGTMTGYDLDLAVGVRSAVEVPITLLGGAGSLSDMEALIRRLGVVGAAAGSLFVFKGRFRAVLITYPSRAERDQLARSS
jgi:cyclase